MIVVAGESLVDLVVDSQGGVVAIPGGGPFNAARTCARLGLAARFLGRFSQDRFGGILAERLRSDGVEIALADRVARPTTLAIVELDEAGSARYWFHLQGTATFLLDHGEAAATLTPEVTALHLGTLGLVVSPMAGVLEGLTFTLSEAVLLMVDPNCRPNTIADMVTYRARLERILERTDAVKASVEDLGFLFPGSSVDDAAKILLQQGPTTVLVTDGARPARAYLGDQIITVAVPEVAVVDTVGAGDAFGGAFLSWWERQGLSRNDLSSPDLVRRAVTAAVEVSSITCTRPGADPPFAAELSPGLWS